MSVKLLSRLKLVTSMGVDSRTVTRWLVPGSRPNSTSPTSPMSMPSSFIVFTAPGGQSAGRGGGRTTWGVLVQPVSSTVHKPTTHVSWRPGTHRNALRCDRAAGFSSGFGRVSFSRNMVAEVSAGEGAGNAAALLSASDGSPGSATSRTSAACSVGWLVHHLAG
ncbi:MAG TPA: hypothetical protein VFZ09_45830, partial [Archangium sp.]|uniref:hypothetical protein n=1 Tax=Archangium sp. TaxID=1872627 RepID=UPI002E369431